MYSSNSNCKSEHASFKHIAISVKACNNERFEYIENCYFNKLRCLYFQIENTSKIYARAASAAKLLTSSPSL